MTALSQSPVLVTAQPIVTPRPAAASEQQLDDAARTGLSMRDMQPDSGPREGPLPGSEAIMLPSTSSSPGPSYNNWSPQTSSQYASQYAGQMGQMWDTGMARLRSVSLPSGPTYVALVVLAAIGMAVAAGMFFPTMAVSSVCLAFGVVGLASVVGGRSAAAGPVYTAGPV